MHKNEIKVPNPMLNLLKVASNASFNAFSIKLKKGYAIEKRIYFYIHVQNVHLTASDCTNEFHFRFYVWDIHSSFEKFRSLKIWMSVYVHDHSWTKVSVINLILGLIRLLHLWWQLTSWSPSPLKVILWPSFIPLSTWTSNILVSFVTFFPLHSLHLSFSLMISPAITKDNSFIIIITKIMVNKHIKKGLQWHKYDNIPFEQHM